LEVANDKLKELDQMKSEFLSLATHQIRSPLTAIRGYAAMILDGDFGEIPAKVKEAVGVISKSCVNLINIVGDFLDISRIEQGRMAYNSEKFDIRDAVKEAVSELSLNANKAGLKLSSHIPKDGNFTVNADKGKVRQILGNIIDNAIKYTKAGGSVSLSLHKKNHQAVIEVTDTGIGISKKDLPHIFNRFYRGSKTAKTIGSGLGLAIAQGIVIAHHGEISISSSVGKGTKVTISLPLHYHAS